MTIRVKSEGSLSPSLSLGTVIIRVNSELISLRRGNDN
jgi:hypothetical protein